MTRLLMFLLLAGLTLAPHRTAQGGETVTISRERLAELERKAAEADRLRSELDQLKAQLSSAPTPPAAASGAPPPAMVRREPVPPVAAVTTLPGLQRGDTVAASDLAQHFQQERIPADARYAGKRFRVEGEVLALEKPMFNDDYKVILKTGSADLRVVGVIDTRDRFNAVYTIKHGQEVVGRGRAGEQETLVRAGEWVVLEGKCKGISESAVVFTDCKIEQRRRGDAAIR